LASILIDKGFDCITGGTDTHLVLLDLRGSGVTGKEGEQALASAGITTNKNAIPFDPLPPSVASGIRIGTPGITTRGMKEDEIKQIGELISKVLSDYNNESLLSACKKEVNDLCSRFPIYPNLL
jgi:glycine hydroxymethyltransferase